MAEPHEIWIGSRWIYDGHGNDIGIPDHDRQQLVAGQSVIVRFMGPDGDEGGHLFGSHLVQSVDDPMRWGWCLARELSIHPSGPGDQDDLGLLLSMLADIAEESGEQLPADAARGWVARIGNLTKEMIEQAARPAYIVRPPATTTTEEMAALRASWKAINRGDVIVASEGLEITQVRSNLGATLGLTRIVAEQAGLGHPEGGDN